MSYALLTYSSSFDVSRFLLLPLADKPRMLHQSLRGAEQGTHDRMTSYIKNQLVIVLNLRIYYYNGECHN